MTNNEEVVDEEQPVAVGGDESETTLTPVELEKPIDAPKYEVRPGLGEKFQSQNVSDIILYTMQEQLMGRVYRSDQAPRWAKMIANGVRQRVQGLQMKRYKIVVQTQIVEMKGAGIKCGQRCIWDPETDYYAQELYRNETIFCHTAVYGVYMY